MKLGKREGWSCEHARVTDPLVVAGVAAAGAASLSASVVAWQAFETRRAANAAVASLDLTRSAQGAAEQSLAAAVQLASEAARSRRDARAPLINVRLGASRFGRPCSRLPSAANRNPCAGRSSGYRKTKALESGQVDAVLAWHVDRLHRSPKELEGYIDICEPRKVLTRTVRAGELDLATASGRMVARQLGAVARYESEQTAGRVRAGKADAASRGAWQGGQRVFGYESVPAHERVPTPAELVRALVAVFWHEDQGTRVRRSGVVRAAAQAAVVVAQDERLRLLAGSALGRRTDQSKQSAAGVDDPRRHDQSPQVAGHFRGPDGGLQSTGQTAYERCEGLLAAV